VVKRKPVQKTVSPLVLATLREAVADRVRPSHLSDLRECVAAGLVRFADPVHGAPILTDAGRQALEVLR
jgi:hypothetical protein